MELRTVDEIRDERDKNNGKIKSKVTYTQNWPAYNKAQTEEWILFQEILKDLVKELEEENQDNGRPRLTLAEQAFCSILKVYSQLSSRRANGMLKDLQKKNLISHKPHFNTPSKFLNRKDVTQLLERLITITARPFISVETVFAVDSSGFRTTSFNEYCKNKHGGKKQHKWLKAHIGVGVKTNVIAGVMVTKEYANDCPHFKRIMQMISESGFDPEEVLADKAYSSRENYEIVRRLGGQAFIPFRCNAKGRRKGSKLWHKMFHYFQLNREEFLRHYHQRSNVETTFHMIKMKFGDKLKSKNFTAQKNELLCKIIANNIVVLIHEMHELGIEPDFNTTMRQIE